MTDYDGGTPASAFSTTDGVIDYTSPLGQVRLLITDVSADPALQLFSDDQLGAFLTMALDQSVHRAAAQALDVIAASEVLVGKKIRTQDLQTDGPAVAAELRAQAAQLRVTADQEDGFFFDIVTPSPYPSTYGEAAEFPRPMIGRGFW